MTAMLDTQSSLDIDNALAFVEKSQQLAGHFPDADAIDRAHRVLTSELTFEEAQVELDGMNQADSEADRVLRG